MNPEQKAKIEADAVMAQQAFFKQQQKAAKSEPPAGVPKLILFRKPQRTVPKRNRP